MKWPTGRAGQARRDAEVDVIATITQLQWVVDAYNLTFAALLLTFGILSDRLGRKGILPAGR